MVKGPSGVIIEKSDDGEEWGRVVEITDMKHWGIEDQLYKFVPMDQCATLNTQTRPVRCVRSGCSC